MKKGLVYGALCALTLAVPAAAEKIYVPVLGATKLWVASADGVERAVPTGRVGLATVDADSVENVRALLDDRLEVPAFTGEEIYQAGLEVPLGDLPRPREIKSLTVGAANVSEQTASCVATLSHFQCLGHVCRLPRTHNCPEKKHSRARPSDASIVDENVESYNFNHSSA